MWSNQVWFSLPQDFDTVSPLSESCVPQAVVLNPTISQTLPSVSIQTTGSQSSKREFTQQGHGCRRNWLLHCLHIEQRSCRFLFPPPRNVMVVFECAFCFTFLCCNNFVVVFWCSCFRNTAIMWYAGLGFTLSPMGMVQSPLSARAASPKGAGNGSQLPQPSPPQPGGPGQQTGAAAGVYRKINSPAQGVATAGGSMTVNQQLSTVSGAGPAGSAGGNSVTQTFKMPSTTATSGLSQQFLHQGSGTFTISLEDASFLGR